MRIPDAIAQREPLWRRLAIVAGIGILIGCIVQAIIKVNEGDFSLHWETGRRFLAREYLYANGHDFPYPPFFGMVYAPTALFPRAVAKAIFFPAGVAALLILLWVLRQLVRPAFRLNDRQTFWVTVVALFLTIQFVIHDQAILALNTALTLLILLSVYWWRQGRDLAAGVSLGLAIAIKCIPAIFTGYFLWKRQWKLAFCSFAAALAFTVAPVVWQGPASYSRHMQQWIQTAIDGISGSGFEQGRDFRDKNIALRPALMRYLVHQEHFGRFGDPPPLDLLNLPAPVAHAIVNAILLTIVLVFLWWSFGRVANRDDPRLLWELSAVGILMVLASPITWGQHCVALLPACFLIGALFAVRARMPGWIVTLLAFYIPICVLAGRDLIGRDISLVLVSYHVSTFCIVGLLPILLAGPRLQRAAMHDC